MTWTYRVVIRKISSEDVFGIHEAYDDGNIDEPHSITTDPVAVTGGSIEELRQTLERMMKALSRPVLDPVEFEKKKEKKTDGRENRSRRDRLHDARRAVQGGRGSSRRRRA